MFQDSYLCGFVPVPEKKTTYVRLAHPKAICDLGEISMQHSHLSKFSSFFQEFSITVTFLYTINGRSYTPLLENHDVPMLNDAWKMGSSGK